MPKINELHWGSSFKRAYRKRVSGTPQESAFKERIGYFIEDPFDPRLRTHRLSGKLDGLWAFSITYDCRVVFQFLGEDKVLLIDIGTHDEVY